MGIKHKETVDCESDDWIASYALKYGEENQVVIASFDSDFFQLVTHNVSVLRYRGECTKIWTPADVMEKFGVAPSKYADFKSLTGDASDNIKGAQKVGPKTAADLLSEFGSLENVISSADAIKKPSVRESVVSSKERLKINYRLIKLNSNIPIPFEISSLKYTPINSATTSVLKAIGVM
jgi:DNA polymerase-1